MLGIALVVAGLVLLFAKAGFPPKITTTYSYNAAGGVTKTTSPSDTTIAISVGLLLVGSILTKSGSGRRGGA